jgi:hypothetical protein
MKAWKSEIIEGRIEQRELRALVEKTVAIPEGAVFAAFVHWTTEEGIEHKLELHHGIRFEIILRDHAEKQG